MPTYEYECPSCGLRFEQQQSMTDDPLTACPQCGKSVRRRISGGLGFTLKDANTPDRGGDPACSLEQTGATCCGRGERCGKPPCGEGG